MTDCIFCKILTGEIPSTKIYEDEHTYAFMDLFPQSKGHCLVIPRAHAENFLESELEDIQHCMATLKKLMPAVKQAMGADGLRLVQFNGAAAGQTVWHTHFHIIPAYEGVTLGAHATKQAEISDLQDHADRIIAALA